MDRLLFFLLAASMSFTATFSGLALANLEESLKAAMASDIRTDEERARDAQRKPIETLEFFGLKEDMRVLELIPGGAWYTKLLAPALAEHGKLYVALGADAVRPLVEQGKLPKVEILEQEGALVRPAGQEPRIQVDGLRLPVENLDLVLTFRNMHNFTPEGRKILNAEVFRVLRSGGLYGVKDHTRRHMEPDTRENWRRMDPVEMIKEIEAAGFEFVDYSTLHYTPDDELRYEVGRRSVENNSDRFTLLFRKP
jgi:predicted methyltransferase